MISVVTVLLPGHHRAEEGKDGKPYLWVQDNPSPPFHRLAPGWHHVLEREMKERVNEWDKPLPIQRICESQWKNISLG